MPYAQGLCIAALVTLAPAAASAQNLDRATREGWPVTRSWDAAAEAEYSAFVHEIGRAVAHGRCHTLRTCLNVPGIDPLAEPVRSAPLLFRADCADVPYLLRAWFAYRRGLPFAHAARMLGAGDDERYLRSAYPEGHVLWTDYPTPRALFEGMGHGVHSGFFRTSPKQHAGDFYHVTIARESIRPGTVFYDPNGHVLVVYEVRRDGTVFFFDGHIGGRLTHGPLAADASPGPFANGGGFKNFRPISFRDGTLVAAADTTLEDFGAGEQFTETGGTRPGFAQWVRTRLRLRAPVAQRVPRGRDARRLAVNGDASAGEVRSASGARTSSAEVLR